MKKLAKGAPGGETRSLKSFKDGLIRMGFAIPTGAIFYKVLHGDNKGLIGMKVGYYEHSCHVDSSDIYVLLHIDKYGTFIEDYWGFMDLEEIKR